MYAASSFDHIHKPLNIHHDVKYLPLKPTMLYHCGHQHGHYTIWYADRIIPEDP